MPTIDNDARGSWRSIAAGEGHLLSLVTLTDPGTAPADYIINYISTTYAKRKCLLIPFFFTASAHTRAQPIG